MEAIRSSETSGTTQRTTRRHIPEEDTLQNHRCENLKSYTINHVAQNCFAQHKFAHSRSSQSAPYTINHVAQHAMLRNMIDRVWAIRQATCATSIHTV
jgi:hypothetical protein